MFLFLLHHKSIMRQSDAVHMIFLHVAILINIGTNFHLFFYKQVIIETIPLSFLRFFILSRDHFLFTYDLSPLVAYNSLIIHYLH
jgi:hypothetical protein